VCFSTNPQGQSKVLGERRRIRKLTAASPPTPNFRLADNLPNERPDWALQVIQRSGPSYERGISELYSFS
jgi:hypothetical protein